MGVAHGSPPIGHGSRAERDAEEHPDRDYLRFGDGPWLSYAEVNARANRVANALIAPAAALATFPRMNVGEEDARHLTHGRPVECALPDAETILVLHDARLLAIGRAVGGRLEPNKVFV